MDLTVLLRGRREHLDRFANTRGSAGERTVLNEQSEWLPRPNGKARDNLMEALKSSGVQIKPSSFDAIALPPGVRVDLSR